MPIAKYFCDEISACAATRTLYYKENLQNSQIILLYWTEEGKFFIVDDDEKEMDRNQGKV